MHVIARLHQPQLPSSPPESYTHHNPPVANFLDIYLHVFAFTKNKTLREYTYVYYTSFMYIYAKIERKTSIKTNAHLKAIGESVDHKERYLKVSFFFTSTSIADFLAIHFVQFFFSITFYTHLRYTYIILIFQLFNLNL